VQLAYSSIANGPPLVKTGNWMTHLEFDFESPIWRHLYRELSRDHTRQPQATAAIRAGDSLLHDGGRRAACLFEHRQRAAAGKNRKLDDPSRIRFREFLEFDFESPIWRHLYRELSRDHTLIRYDARGNGLSDRDVEEVSFETFVSDLEAVVDGAGLERFALFGISQGCAVSIAYAVRHPERLTRLILLGS
jgi:hypothetical protein